MKIKTWTERCDDHPDHQTGMISHSMIQARMQEEIEDLRAEVERLREVIRTIRARCVEMDDSDAVSETLDISSAALEDEP